jgi:hypothetical protein
MQEPSLSQSSGKADVMYRFLWLRSFDRPISVRIEKSGSSVNLYAVELDGRGGNDPGRILRKTQKALPAAEFERLTTKLRQPGFWQMWKVHEIGLDGAEWILESMQDGRYQVANQWTPDSGEFRDVCLLFLEFAGLLPMDRVY